MTSAISRTAISWMKLIDPGSRKIAGSRKNLRRLIAIKVRARDLVIINLLGAEQPNFSASSTMQVAGPVNPGWLVKMEVLAVRP